MGEVGVVSPKLGFLGLISTQTKNIAELWKVILGAPDGVRRKKNISRNIIPIPT